MNKTSLKETLYELLPPEEAKKCSRQVKKLIKEFVLECETLLDLYYPPLDDEGTINKWIDAYEKLKVINNVS